MDLSVKDGGLPPDSVVQTVDEIMKDSIDLIDKYHDTSFRSKRRIALAPCSPFSVSEELLVEYNAIRYEPVQYEITGRKSSWGMNIGQVTWIMVGVLTFCVVGVGSTMYLLNKRKLKNGYVPDISDEDMQTLK